jgi:S-adenosylmethionine:tRNA ribosyltransferase-isomerase
VRTADFDYALPPELIAQTPAPARDQARLLVVHRAAPRIEHRTFAALPEYLQPGDVLVLNNSRVIPARLRGVKPATGGQVEVLLVREQNPREWWVLLRPGKRVRRGTRLMFARHPRPTNAVRTRLAPGTSGAVAAPAGVLAASVVTQDAEGRCLLQFTNVANVRDVLDDYGEVPLPPYVQRQGAPTEEDRERYQTVFAAHPGSVAAPTAGLHFTEALLAQVRDRGVRVCFVTLHVGLGTFAPVKADRVEDHVMHEEAFALSADTAAAVNAARRAGRRVLAAGTTTTRVLESLTGELRECRGCTRAYIYPPFKFRVVAGLLTNFHLPRSTLLMLVSAFAAPESTSGRDLVLAAYAEAVRERYRFYSYGDATLWL